MTRISRARARMATAWPMRPRPMMPSVLPASWVPMNFLRSQRLLHQALVGGGEFRDRPSIRASVCRPWKRCCRRGVHHHDALAGGGLGVDVVDAHAGPGDGPQALVAGQDFGGDFHAAAADAPSASSRALRKSSPFSPVRMTTSIFPADCNKSSPSWDRSSSTMILRHGIVSGLGVSCGERAAGFTPRSGYRPRNRYITLAHGSVGSQRR